MVLYIQVNTDILKAVYMICAFKREQEGTGSYGSQGVALEAFNVNLRNGLLR